MKRKETPNHDSVPPFDEIFNDRDWVTIDNRQLTECQNFFDADPNVQTGFNFRMDALLNGGILFKRDNHVMGKKSKEDMSRKFNTFLRSVVRSRWSAGFTACAWILDEEDGGGIPVVLDLPQLTVKYKYTIFGEPKYRYFYQPNFGSLNQVEIPNVKTFSWEPPNQYGNLRSMMLLLAPDHLSESSRNMYMMIAMKGRAMPPMISEKEQQQHDKEPNAILAKKSKQRMRANLMEDTPSSNEVAAIARVTHQIYDQTSPSLANAMTNTIASVNQIPDFSSHYQLSEGRHFINARLPEGPGDYLEFRVARQERAFALMGIPMAMVSNSSSTRAKQGNKETSNNEFLMFENSQQSLKLELINLVKAIYDSIYMQSHIEEYLRDTPPQEWNAKAAMKSADVHVEIPSIPMEDKLMSWYTSGFLKYESLISYISSKHGIPKESFNPTPGLTLPESNGSFQKEESPAKKAKK